MSMDNLYRWNGATGVAQHACLGTAFTGSSEKIANESGFKHMAVIAAMEPGNIIVNEVLNEENYICQPQTRPAT